MVRLTLLKNDMGSSFGFFGNKENLGFAGGNNIGIQAARGEDIVLLNNVTRADPHWLEELVKATQSDPVIRMWASKVCSYYQRDRIEAAGELIYWDGLCRARGQYEKGSWPVQRDGRNPLSPRVRSDVPEKPVRWDWSF